MNAGGLAKWGILGFFLLAGAGLVAISYLDPVTAFLDANATADSDPASPVLRMIGLIWLAVSVGAAVIVKLSGGLTMSSGSADRKLLATGTRADALVETVEHTHVSINDVPRWNLRLRVEPSGRSPFTVEKKVTLPSSWLPEPGERIAVVFDPARAGAVALVRDQSGALTVTGAPQTEVAGTRPVAAALEQLDELRRSGALSDEEFSAAKARVLGPS